MDNVHELEELVDAVINTPEKTGAAMKHLSELMNKHRTEHPEVYTVDAETGENRGSAVQDDYDPYTGKYAFVSPDDNIDDEEYEDAAQEAHDELVRSLIKPRCHKCVYELRCSKNKDNERSCPDYKRDAPDGGYYG